jgi:hypothetical protein
MCWEGELSTICLRRLETADDLNLTGDRFRLYYWGPADNGRNRDFSNAQCQHLSIASLREVSYVRYVLLLRTRISRMEGRNGKVRGRYQKEDRACLDTRADVNSARG